MIPYQILCAVTIDETHNLCCENIFSQKNPIKQGDFPGKRSQTDENRGKASRQARARKQDVFPMSG